MTRQPSTAAPPPAKPVPAPRGYHRDTVSSSPFQRLGNVGRSFGEHDGCRMAGFGEMGLVTAVRVHYRRVGDQATRTDRPSKFVDGHSFLQSVKGCVRVHPQRRSRRFLLPAHLRSPALPRRGTSGPRHLARRRPLRVQTLSCREGSTRSWRRSGPSRRRAESIAHVGERDPQSPFRLSNRCAPDRSGPRRPRPRQLRLRPKGGAALRRSAAIAELVTA